MNPHHQKNIKISSSRWVCCMSYNIELFQVNLLAASYASCMYQYICFFVYVSHSRPMGPNMLLGCYQFHLLLNIAIL